MHDGSIRLCGRRRTLSLASTSILSLEIMSFISYTQSFDAATWRVLVCVCPDAAEDRCSMQSRPKVVSYHANKTDSQAEMSYLGRLLPHRAAPLMMLLTFFSLMGFLLLVFFLYPRQVRCSLLEHELVEKRNQSRPRTDHL